MSDGGNCSFCGKSHTEVFRLIAGPTSMICNECVGRCANMIADEFQKAADHMMTLQPKPRDNSGAAAA